MKTGIYVIEHRDSGKVYVGSAKNFAQRWRVHRCLLGKGQHHSAHLQSAWAKYGTDAFVFRRVLVCAVENLLVYEQLLIDAYRAADRRFGFNARPVAESVLGMKHSDAARAKIRAKRATQVFSAETRAMWSRNRTGRKMPPEVIAAKVARKMALPREKRGKLSVEQVAFVKQRFMSGMTQRDIAAEFGVHQSTVSNIVRECRRTAKGH